mmetsp:Transcript_2350/g.4959  ORF Transcript_2350/g.4959 Transcript_2350/m.4959 type:complete len:253 (+) Transcript_2350:67-825(+)
MVHQASRFWTSSLRQASTVQAKATSWRRPRKRQPSQYLLPGVEKELERRSGQYEMQPPRPSSVASAGSHAPPINGNEGDEDGRLPVCAVCERVLGGSGRLHNLCLRTSSRNGRLEAEPRAPLRPSSRNDRPEEGLRSSSRNGWPEEEEAEKPAGSSFSGRSRPSGGWPSYGGCRLPQSAQAVTCGELWSHFRVDDGALTKITANSYDAPRYSKAANFSKSVQKMTKARNAEGHAGFFTSIVTRDDMHLDDFK